MLYLFQKFLLLLSHFLRPPTYERQALHSQPGHFFIMVFVPSVCWKWKMVAGQTEDKMPLFFSILCTHYMWKILLIHEARQSERVNVLSRNILLENVKN